MSADLLRRAAKMLRERAEAVVIHGPWEYRDRSDDPDRYPWTVFAAKSNCSAGTGFAAGTAEYIALMHPPVAIAVAAWLGCVAIDEETEPESGPRTKELTAALIVARAVLREPEPPMGPTR